MVLEYPEDYFVGKRNEIFEWYVFNSRQQQNGESVQAYIAALRKQAAVCGSESITPDEILGDKIVRVSGVQDERLGRSLLSRSKLNLKECITECRMRQQAEKQAATMASGNSQEREAANQDINQACTHAARKRFKTLEGMQEQRRQWTQETREATWREQKRCEACGRQHDRGRCPAFGRFCNLCGSLITYPTCVGLINLYPPKGRFLWRISFKFSPRASFDILNNILESGFDFHVSSLGSTNVPMWERWERDDKNLPDFENKKKTYSSKAKC